MNVKMHPSCSMTHRPIDGLFSIVSEHELNPEQIDTITCVISKRAASILKYHHPKDGMEAKFSLEYCIASAVLNQEVSLAQFHDEQVKRADIQKMMKRIHILTEKDKEEETATVMIKTKEGDTYTSTVIHPIGSGENPLTPAQVKQKFSECVRHIMHDEQQRKAFSYLEKLEEAEEMKNVIDAFNLDVQMNQETLIQ